MPDDLIDRLAAARPTPTELRPPNEEVLEAILAASPVRRRVVTPLRLGAMAAAAAVLVAALIALPSQDAAEPRPSRMHMRRIVESTASALSSGRARVHFESKHDREGPKPRVETSDFVVEFAGDNRAMAGTVDPGDGRGASTFPIANKVVDGRFYLQDGTRWIEDTAANLTGADVFSVDPRNFLSGVADAAQFEERGRATIDGVPTRHLVATEVENIPAFNLGLGPTNAKNDGIRKFEVWVDDDDVVRSLLVTATRHETYYEGARTVLVDGKKTLDETSLTNPKTSTTVTLYQVAFVDLGSDIRIVAPANAPKIEGKG